MYMKAHEPMVVLRKGNVTSLYIYNVKVGSFNDFMHMTTRTSISVSLTLDAIRAAYES